MGGLSLPQLLYFVGFIPEFESRVAGSRNRDKRSDLEST